MGETSTEGTTATAEAVDEPKKESAGFIYIRSLRGESFAKEPATQGATSVTYVGVGAQTAGLIGKKVSSKAGENLIRGKSADGTETYIELEAPKAYIVSVEPSFGTRRRFQASPERTELLRQAHLETVAFLTGEKFLPTFVRRAERVSGIGLAQPVAVRFDKAEEIKSEIMVMPAAYLTEVGWGAAGIFTGWKDRFANAYEKSLVNNLHFRVERAKHDQAALEMADDDGMSIA